MTQKAPQLDTDIPLESLANNAFEAFCEDISSMFGNVAECRAGKAGQGPLTDLKKEFKKIASVNHIQALGALDGSLHLLLDQGGVFVLAGVFVMLPEKRILETIRGGTLKDADYINDAIKEVGNLMIGSWDRIFREELDGHKHFKQTGTFVGSLWDDTNESVGIAEEQSCRYVICTMKIDDLPEFKCAAVFPDTLFGAPEEPEAPEPEAEATAEPAQEPKQEAPQAAAQPQEQPPQEKPEATAAASEAPPQPETETELESEATSEAEAKTQATDAPDHSADAAGAAAPDASGEESKPAAGPVSQAIAELTRPLTRAPLSCDINAAAEYLALPVTDIMAPAVLWVDPEDTVEVVLRQMQQQNVGYALVGQDGQMDGILSHRDIAAAISPFTRPMFAQWRRPADDATMQIRVKWFMSRPVHTVSPEATLAEAMESMLKHSVRGLPVVDAKGQTHGLITVYDIFSVLLGAAGVSLTGQPRQTPAGDLTGAGKIDKDI